MSYNIFLWNLASKMVLLHQMKLSSKMAPKWLHFGRFLGAFWAPFGDSCGTILRTTTCLELKSSKIASWRSPGPPRELPRGTPRGVQEASKRPFWALGGLWVPFFRSYMRYSYMICYLVPIFIVFWKFFMDFRYFYEDYDETTTWRHDSDDDTTTTTTRRQHDETTYLLTHLRRLT